MSSDMTPEIDYQTKPMSEWSDVGAELIITDPPFGIEFDGGKSNYNRDESNVVDGYVEWDVAEYEQKIESLFNVIADNVAENGQALIFSGWNNSHIIQRLAIESQLTLEGKLYWSYNFAPYCTRRPAHNVYEIFWLTNSDDWYYTNECSHDHCTEGEANLSSLIIPRDYHRDMPKYPTRLPEEVVAVLLEHFSESGDTVFDPLAGSGMVGCVAKKNGRDAVLGDLNAEAKTVFQEIKEKICD